MSKKRRTCRKRAAGHHGEQGVSLQAVGQVAVASDEGTRLRAASGSIPLPIQRPNNNPDLTAPPRESLAPAA